MHRGDGPKARDEIETVQGLSILVVGEGNGFGDIPAFEYVLNLASAKPAWLVIGSRLGDAPRRAVQEELPDIAGLPNVRLLDNVDATRLPEGAITGRELYDRIIFNNPHVEEGDALARALATSALIDGFVRSARPLLTPGGFARVVINPQFVDRYPDVSGAIARAGGQLVGRFGNDPELYAPFTPLRTLGGLIRLPGDEPAGIGLAAYNFSKD